MQSNITDKVVFASPKNAEERSHLGQMCVRKLGIKFPAIIDTFDNATEQAYTAWPDRLYVIDREGRIAYKARPGPFGFHPEGVAETLQKLLPAAK
jgi:peroxiredoxin